MTRRFFTLDVFTETPLAGNPLAVVLDAEGLDDARMQAIAAEFNLSETVFVFEPRNAINSASVRIFTPARELPFAGHPTVGTAALLAHVRSPDALAVEDLTIVLEERVGDIVCVVEHRAGRALVARFGAAEAARAPRLRAAVQSRDRRRRRPRAPGHRLRPARAEPLQRRRALSVHSRSFAPGDRPRSARRHVLGRQGWSGRVSLHQRSRRAWFGLSRADVRRRLGRGRRPGDRKRCRRFRRRRARLRSPRDGDQGSSSNRATRWAARA